MSVSPSLELELVPSAFESLRNGWFTFLTRFIIPNITPLFHGVLVAVAVIVA